MSTDKVLRKPHPDAIQTIYGWALPKTGEILVARRDLPNPVDGFKPNRPYIVKEVKEEEEVEKQDVVEKNEDEKDTRRRLKKNKENR